jgi:glycosyltransferase involved in cell wall biosynthesis
MARRYFIASGCSVATTSLYRCVHLQGQLETLGHEAVVVDWFEEAKIDVEAALGFDVIVLYRLPMSEALERLIKEAHRLGKPVIFDTDDLVFEPELTVWHRAVKSLSPGDQAQHLEGVRRYLLTLLACDAVTVATPLLADLAGKRGQRAFVHHNALGCEMRELADALCAQRQDRVVVESKVVIGYGSGTATHDADFGEVAAALEHVLERFPETELWTTGPLSLPASLQRFGDQVQRYPLSDWQTWFGLMARMDIALAPLEMGNVFCRAKSEIKFVEAGALGLPVVASKIDPFQDSITNGKDGFLAANDAEWTEALTALIQDPQLRAQIGAAARETVMRNYSPEARTADLAKLLPRLERP